MIKHIIFDLGGVLLNLDMPRSMAVFQSIGADISQLLQSTSALPSTGRAQATLCDGVVAGGVMDLYQTGDVDTAQLVSEIQSHCSSAVTAEQILQAWNACILDLPKYKLDYLCQLRDRGYHIHLLSNTNDAHWQLISAQCFGGHPEQYFSHIFLSQEMHMSKPNADIFQSVLHTLQAVPEECLFLDDSQANVDAAAALGYQVFKVPVRHDYRAEIDNMLAQDSGDTSAQLFCSVDFTVQPQNLASAMGSGDMDVLATPTMVAWMENAAMQCAAALLTEADSTVGSQISVSHLRPTALGGHVTATAKLIGQEGRKLSFHVQAVDDHGLIGEGEHTRYIINREKFLSKL